MKRTLYCAVLFATFSGCASTGLPERRDVVTELRVERVEVPVRVPCIAASDVPTKPIMPPINIKTADLKQLAAAMSAYVIELIQYADVVGIVLSRCVATAPK